MKTLKITMEARFDPKTDDQRAELEAGVADMQERRDEFIAPIREFGSKTGFVGGGVAIAFAPVLPPEESLQAAVRAYHEAVIKDVTGGPAKRSAARTIEFGELYTRMITAAGCSL
jgi:hypothetical protein